MTCTNNTPSHKKRRRGTVIVELPDGILLTRMRRDHYLLPGGQAEKNEPRIMTAIRELKEETGLIAEEVRYLFDFESHYYRHKVFYIRASGIPVPSHEIDTLAYYQADMPDLADSSRKIIACYLAQHKSSMV
ncbi:NUDIX domain-containing protein [Aeromonas veronii]